jgi:hypothetical protein
MIIGEVKSDVKNLFYSSTHRFSNLSQLAHDTSDYFRVTIENDFHRLLFKK